MLVGITIIFYSCTEIILSTPGFSVAISKDGFKLSCKLLPFASNNTINYDGPYKFFKIFLSFYTQTKRVQNLFLVHNICDMWKGRLSFQ
jgi:hypothetical protein